MPHDTSAIRLRAGVSAVALLFAVLLVFGVLQVSEVELPAQAIERGAMDTILPNLAANGTAVAYVVWGEVILWVLLCIFGVDLYRVLADGRSALVFAPLAIIGGTALIIIELLLLLGISHGLAPAYVGAGGADQATIAAAALTLLRFRNRMIVVAGILFAFAAIIFGREMVDSAVFPDWLGYLGYTAGAVGFIGGLFPLFVPLFLVRSLGLFLFALWVVIGGITLLRGRDAAPTG